MATFLLWRLSSKADPRQFDSMFEQLKGYGETYERLTGRNFTEARVLEIGYGARPLRLISLMSMGIDARGVDLDMPMLRFSPTRLLGIMRTNGPERALKTAVRNLLFDRAEYQNLQAALALRGRQLCVEPARFMVGNAATANYGTETVDLIYSEDVFEHIPLSDLDTLVARLASLISPQGLAVITPNVFTGITGGHLPEWYGHLVDAPTQKRSEPWEHLRKARFTANTYLNQVPLSVYREVFGKHFQIREETVAHPDLGRNLLDPEVRQELACWKDEELFSNQVRFVLRPRDPSGERQ